MIINEKAVQNKILQRTLIQQLVKIRSKIIRIPKQYQQIQYLTNKIESQQINLEDIKEKLSIRKNQISKFKYQLLNDLEKEKSQKRKEFQNAKLEIKQLNQKCFQIRSKRQQIQEICKIQSRLNNELEEVEINIKEGQHEALAFQFLTIEQQTEQKQLLQLRKEKSKFIDEQKVEKQKQKNIVDILSQKLLEMQNEILTLNYEKNKLQISEAFLKGEIEQGKIEVQRMKQQNTKKKLEVFQIDSEMRKKQVKISEQLDRINKNRLISQNIRVKIEMALIQMSELNEKIIKTRQFVISLNVCKNEQKKLNQQLKLKIKQLMEITLEMTKDSPQL